MATTIHDIPEILALSATSSMVRLPPETDAPVTERVRRLMDTAAFRRLARVSQLGLVALVYPGATHSRFEHSLGVYRNALLFLKQLGHDSRFAAIVSAKDAERLIAAALLHDVGHWPFCHPIEDLGLADVPRHEDCVARCICTGDIATILRRDWDLDPTLSPR